MPRLPATGRSRPATTAMMSRTALARVLSSLLTAELRAARGRGGSPASVSPPAAWTEDLALGEGGLDCDSLERLSLAAATNEMFHLHERGTEADLLSGERFGDWLDAIEAAWRDGVARVTVTTSGSTGRPKRCIHAGDHLAAEIDTLAERWADRRRVVAFAPAHHIYGLLFCALLPDRLGVPVISAEGRGAAALAEALQPGDLVVSFPERWAFLARSLPAWPGDILGVTSTAPCPPDLIVDLRHQGLAGLTEVYGSSETAGIAMRDEPDAPYRLMPQWRFTEPLHPDAPTLVHRSGREVAVMDKVARVGADTFHLAGRRDGMVQVGGVNVSPDEVARKLASRPGVSAAAVRLMRPSEGSRLKAYLVPAEGIDPDALRIAIETWVARMLPASERPTAITIGPPRSTNALGKAEDW